MAHNTSSNYFSNIDKKLSMSFSVLIFFIVGIIFLATSFYFDYIVHKEQNRLGSVIANSIGDSINRVSFSGKYQARLLVEDLKHKNTNIDSIIVQDATGEVIAHSTSTFNGQNLQDEYFAKAKEVMQTNTYATQTVLVTKNDKKTTLIEIDVPYKRCLDNDTIGVTRIYLSAESLHESIRNAIFFLAVFALLLSIVSYFIVKKLSDNISAPIKSLAFQLQGILQYAPLIISITNKNGEILSASPLYDARKDSIKEIAEELSAEQEVFKSGVATSYNYTIKHNDNVHYFHSSKYPIAMNAKNGVELVCTIAIDITEQKELEYQITRQKEEFEALFWTTKDGIAIVDLNTKYLDFNDAYLEMTGYSRDELLQKTCLELTAPSDIELVSNLIQNILVAGYVKDVEKNCIVNDGKAISVNMSVALLPDKKRLIISAKDITRQKRFEQELQEMVKQETEKRLEKERLLTQQSKLAAMGEMISNIAHQWRQPLNALALKVQDVPIALEYSELDAEYAASFKKDSMSLINYMSQTIEDFRSFFKPEKAKTKFDVVASMHKSLGLVKDALESSGIKLNLNATQDKIFVYGYANEFTQVVLNIINNAKDALKESANRDRHIAINIKEEQSFATISICDNGGGIPLDVIEKIYEPYFTTKDKAQGTGLGLYMSKIIIEQNMDGKITAYNNALGACFDITIPISS